MILGAMILGAMILSAMTNLSSTVIATRNDISLQSRAKGNMKMSWAPKHTACVALTMLCTIALLPCASFLWAQTEVAAAKVGDVPYAKKATRKATEAYMLSQLRPGSVQWGEWHLSTPYPYAGHGQDALKIAHGPELELLRLRAGSPPFDLSRSYTGKKGTDVSWRDLGEISNGVIELASSR